MTTVAYKLFQLFGRLQLLFVFASLVQAQSPLVEQMLKAAAENSESWTQRLTEDPSGPPAKVSPALREAVRLYAADRNRALKPLARQLDIPVEDERVLVKLTAVDTDSLEPLKKQIAKEDGQIVAEFHGTLFVKLPLAAIEPLTHSQYLDRMTPQQLLAEAPTKDASSDLQIKSLLTATLVDQLHARGITGKGSKVGILETNEAADPDSQHGAMVATIIAAIAPDSERISERYTSEGDFMAAVDRLVADGVQVINHSAAWSSEPRNGNGLLDQKVQEVTTQHNILWVNSAGNEARSHWSVTRNGYAGSLFDVVQNLRNSPALTFKAKQDKVRFEVTWNDWGPNPAKPASGEVVRALLFRKGALLPKVISDWHGEFGPSMRLGMDVTVGEEYVLAFYSPWWHRPIRMHIDVDSDKSIDSDSATLYCPPSSTRHPPAEDSVQSPGTAAASVTVGAIELRSASLATGNYGAVADYSSHGPTDQPIQKPDLSAYSGIASDWLPRRFNGTSASAPVVAGLAALVRQMLPTWTAASARAWVLACADRQPTGLAGPNISGQGIVTAARLLAELDHKKSSSLALAPSPDTSLAANAATGTLDRLRGAASEPQPFEIKLVLGRSSYRIGDGMKLGYTSSKPAYFAIFHVDSFGNYALLTSSGAALEPIQAGAQYMFPEDGRITVTGPAGEEEFLLICSEDPINWEALPRELPDMSRISIAVVRFSIRE